MLAKKKEISPEIKARNAQIRKARIKSDWQLYALLVVPILYLIIFNYMPMWNAQIAFRDFNARDGVLGSEWVGFDQFIRFFESPMMSVIIKNTVVISLYGLFATLPFPVLFAILIKYIPYQRFGKFAQTVAYAPHFISTVVMVSIITEVLNPRGGMIDNLLSIVGIDFTANLMGIDSAFSHIYVWSGIWQTMGFSAIVYTAILTGVDQSLHEAAMVDGANVWRRIWHIDLPCLRPQIILMMILGLGNILNVGFEKALLMQNDMNTGSSEMISTYVYKMGIAAPFPDFSYTTAIGLFQSAIAFILVMIVNKIARKVSDTSLW